jgi:hypothetical protein
MVRSQFPWIAVGWIKIRICVNLCYLWLKIRFKRVGDNALHHGKTVQML